MTFPRTRTATAVAAVTIAGLALAGCSSSGAPAAQETLDPADPVSITVGTLAAGDYAPLYLAEQEGYFDDEGLDVTIETIAGGAVGVTQVVSGELDFTAGTWTNILLAVSQGLELQVVREGSSAGKEGVNALIALDGSGIESAEDLRGETVSVNTLGSATELQIRDCLASEGLEPGDYDLVEVPFPDTPAAVSQGRVAAGFVPEPFITIGSSQGLSPILYPAVCNEDQSNSTVVNWSTSRQFAEQNPQVVEAFVRAMDKATELAIDDPSSVSSILPTFTTLTPELAEAIVQPNFNREGTPDVENAEFIMGLMVDYGLLDEPLDDVSQYAFSAGG